MIRASQVMAGSLSLAVLTLFCYRAEADPPGAQVRQKVVVPAGLDATPFDSERFLTLPPGFQVSVWARPPGARFLAVAPNGDVFVSQPGAGKVSVYRPDAAGGIPASFVYATGLRQPHGLAFDRKDGITWLYVAESNQVDRFLYNAGDVTAPRAEAIIRNLPDNSSGGYAHPLKGVAIGPDHSVYVSIGSSCNACASDSVTNPQRASVWQYPADGSGGRLFAAGLRNAEGLAFLPGTNRLWAAVNSRDDLPYPFRDASGNYGHVFRAYVDDHPPDLLTAVRDGGNYGWPFCNSNPDTASGRNQMPLDSDPDNNGDVHVDCATMDRGSKGIPAHSAPLGLAFLQGTGFAAPWRDGVAVAYHGSWDRSTPTGYKVTWFPWDSAGAPGDEADLMTGFWGWGRPVGTAVLPDGSLLVTDDMAGAVYRLRWAPSAVSAANGYPMVAPGSYAAFYGSGLAAQTVAAGSPYPLTLGDVSLDLTDSAGQSKPAPLVYVSPSQINFLVPEGLAEGTARLTLKTGAATRDLGAPEIRGVVPGLFAKDGSGKGEAAAIALNAAGEQVEFPVDVGRGPVYLSLYGSGIRQAVSGTVQVQIGGMTVPALYAGAQPTLAGLDQVNVKLPAALAGAGEVDVRISAGGITSNTVTIRIQ